MATIDEIRVIVDAEVGKYNAKLDEALRRMDGFNTQLNQKGKQNEQLFNKIGTAVAGAFTVDKILDFGKQVILTSAEFERMGAVLTNSLGSSSAAQAAMSRLQAFASTTPFSVREVTESFVQLANRGIIVTNAQLTRMGDVAGALGKPLKEVNEAILDVSNSERWNELGIKVQVAGNKMTGTFRGMSVEVAKTEAGALSMIEAFGKMDGVMGGMAAVSETVAGKISNLGDAFDNLFNTIGKGNRGIISGSLDLIIEQINGLSSAMQSVEDKGLSNAASGIEAQFKSLQGDFNATAEAAKKSGGDIQKALDDLSTANVTHFLDEFGRAKDALDAFRSTNSMSVWEAFNLSTADAIEKQKAYDAQITKLSGNVELYKAILNELPNINKKAFDLSQVVPKSIGLLEQARERLKEIKAAMEKAPNEAALGQLEIEGKSVEKLIEKYEHLADAKTRIGGISTQNNIGRLANGKTFESNSEGLLPPADKAVESMKQYRDRINNVQLIDPDKLVPQNKIDAVIERFKTMGQGGEREMSKMSEAINGALNGAVADALTNFAELIGNVAAGTVSGFENIFGAIMGIVADFLSQFGKSLIAAGVAAIAFDALIENPFAAVAAGVALVAAAAAVKGTLSKGLSGAGGASSSGGGGGSQRGGVNGQLSINGEFVIRGTDLVYIVGKGQARKTRVGG